MTPFARHLEPAPHTPESRYNMIQSSDRNAIERLMSVFKMRWRCTHADNVLRYNPTKCGQIITACAILHSLCILGGVQDYVDAEVRGNNLCRRENAEPGEQFIEGGVAARQRLVHVLNNM
ncbi:hypothetical protein FOCC_FOCC016126 [Frankliniella occidentalis]|nr:hypothetical protein FOCC_FOCC016126 [Frankliniella occidentalis]